MVENAVNQQEKKRKAGTVHFADKMPSKNDDDEATTRTSSISSKVLASMKPMTTRSRAVMVLITEVQAERPLAKNVTV